MNIYIVTECGDKIGYGHLTRCISLYQAFLEKNYSPVVIINDKKSTKFLLKEVKYKCFNWIENRHKLFCELKSDDTVIIDSYLADIDFYKELSVIVNNPVFIDDYNRIKYPSGSLINGSVNAEKINYPHNPDLKYYLGTDYIPIRKTFWEIPIKHINKEVNNILITFGGLINTDYVSKIIDCLNKRSDYNYYVFDPAVRKYSASEILKTMLEADLCISAGGQTTYELARVGVPTIGICFAENQILNLEGWHEKNFIDYIGWFNDEDILFYLEEAVNRMLSCNLRSKIFNLGSRLVDGFGARRIVKKLMK